MIMANIQLIAPGTALAARSLDELGGKAFNLAALAEAGLPVPPAFVLPTAWCRRVRSGELPRAELEAALRSGVRHLEALTGRSFGGSRKPLVVSVRSGAAVSMPGMLETVLDVGITDSSVEGLIRSTGNPRLAWDCYRRLIGLYAEVVGGLPIEPFDRLLHSAVQSDGAATERSLDYAMLRRTVHAMLDLFQELGGARFPQDPYDQLLCATEAVFRSWDAPKAVEYRRRNAIDDDAGTAVIIQAMVYGNAGPRSGAGVGFTRDPATGEDALYLEFQFDSQGEDVVAGRHVVDGTERLRARLPSVLGRLGTLRRELEALFHDVQDFEITVEQGQLYLLQTRHAKRTPWAAVKIAVDLVRDGVATPAEALRTLEGVDLATVARSRVAHDGLQPIGRGIVASLGVASGPVALDIAAAKRFADEGTRPILVRRETTTSDIAGLHAAAGLLTALGGRTAHAAVVARQLGIVSLVGCSTLQIDEAHHCCSIGGVTFNEGDVMGLDGNEGAIYAGKLDIVLDRPTEALNEIRRWSLSS
jgi:pyruvate,orthophosphate dikinase